LAHSGGIPPSARVRWRLASALVAQRVFRHKCRKASFQVAFWIVAALNSMVVLWLAEKIMRGCSRGM